MDLKAAWRRLWATPSGRDAVVTYSLILIGFVVVAFLPHVGVLLGVFEGAVIAVIALLVGHHVSRVRQDELDLEQDARDMDAAIRRLERGE